MSNDPGELGLGGQGEGRGDDRPVGCAMGSGSFGWRGGVLS